MPQTRTGSTRKTPKSLIVLTAALLFCRVIFFIQEWLNPAKAEVKTPGQVNWIALSAADSVSRSTGKPLLYEFSAVWCPPCALMERTVFTDARVADFINRNFVPVKIIDKQREKGANPPDIEALQSRYAVETFPMTVITSPGDSTSSIQKGYHPPRSFWRFLSRSLKALRAQTNSRSG